jgi:hypothetical protein
MAAALLQMAQSKVLTALTAKVLSPLYALLEHILLCDICFRVHAWVTAL